MIILPPKPDSDLDSGSTSYRVKRGSKLSDLPPRSSEDIPSLSKLNGPFQLAEYLSLRVKADPHDVEGLVRVPSGDTTSGGKAPEKDVWIYEHLRRIPIDAAPLVNHLLGGCTKETCPEMKAEEWLYLCAAHGDGQAAVECCAIDYILHTLDSTTAVLNSSEKFPSRMSIPPASLSHFPSLFRRLSRIFSHAYFHHREAFSLAEGETSLYARFLLLCEKHQLVEKSLLPIPDQPKHSESDDDSRSPRGERSRVLSQSDQSQPPTISPPKQVLVPERGSLRGQGSTRGKMTLGRGKKGRGSVLWASEPDPQPKLDIKEETPVENNDEKPLTRTESVETAIHMSSLPPTLEEEPITDPQPEEAEIREEPPVPKDEIELLEEEGKISPEPTFSPLPIRQKPEEDLVEVKLEDAPLTSAPAPDAVSDTSPSQLLGADLNVTTELIAPEMESQKTLQPKPTPTPQTPSSKPPLTANSPQRVPLPVSPIPTTTHSGYKSSTPMGSSPLRKTIAGSPLAYEVTAVPDVEDVEGFDEMEEMEDVEENGSENVEQ